MEAAKAASAEKGVNVAPIVHADTRNGNIVEARLYIDPVKAAELTSSIRLGVNIHDANTRDFMNSFFSNKLLAVAFDQKGSFGMEIQVAVRVDLSEMDLRNLVFYSYDPLTNTCYQLANPKYAVDANGYLHFSTSYGNYLIVSEGGLTVK